MAGTITASLLTRLRTLLDESSAGNWSNDECYSALTDGQKEVLRLLTKKKSPVISPLKTTYTKSSINGTSVSLPSNFLIEYSLKAHAYGGIEQPCILREDDKYRDSTNVYLSSEEDGLYYDMIGNNIVFETSFSSGKMTLDYLAKPNDISSTVDPTVDSLAYGAIVQWAYAFLIGKFRSPEMIQISQNAYKLFYQTVEAL